MNKIKTIFFGSGGFAVPILKELSKIEQIDLVCVVTQPDKPVGRKQELTPTPVGIELKKEEYSKIDILKPEKLKVVAEEILEKYQPELILVASYGQIIPANIVHYPKYKALNFHGSILPTLRGAVPVQMAILQGLKESGVTLQVMQEGMDTGEIISQETINIENKNSEELMQDMASLGVKILHRDLPLWLENKIVAVAQDDSKATYCYKSDLSKQNAEITFKTEIELAERMVRAFYPWPIAWTKLSDGKILKIYRAEISKIHSPLNSNESNLSPKIFREGKKLFMQLENGILELLEMQLEGKKRGSTTDYLFLA